MPTISFRLAALPIFFVLPSFLGAQTPSAPSAPIPIQILNAKKLFIANGGEERNPSGDLYFSGGPDRAYNQFYAGMKDWGRYEIVPEPVDADLVLQIHLSNQPSAGGYNELQLTVLDPKTHVTLWVFSEHAVVAGRQKARDAAFDRAMSLITDDLKKVMTKPEAALVGATK